MLHWLWFGSENRNFTSKRKHVQKPRCCLPHFWMVAVAWHAWPNDTRAQIGRWSTLILVKQEPLLLWLSATNGMLSRNGLWFLKTLIWWFWRNLRSTLFILVSETKAPAVVFPNNAQCQGVVSAQRWCQQRPHVCSVGLWPKATLSNSNGFVIQNLMNEIR